MSRDGNFYAKQYLSENIKNRSEEDSAFYKTLLYASGGAFTLSLSIVQFFKKEAQGHAAYLIWSWVFFASNIALLIVRNLITIDCFDDAIELGKDEDLDEKKKKTLGDKVKSMICTNRWLGRVSVVSFLL